MTQEFHKGDYVRVADDLGSSMSHFRAGCEAIVMGSYADQFGGSDTDSYTLFIKDSGRVSWYHGHQLTLIAKAQLDLLQVWEVSKDTEIAQHSDIDWIFANGKEVLKSCHGASIGRLGKDLGFKNMWGSHGEGMTLYMNSLAVMAVAAPYLINGDKAGWLGCTKRIIVNRVRRR